VKLGSVHPITRPSTTYRQDMSGAELALAIVPLVIVLVQHHRAVFLKSKPLVSPKSKNEQQLDFYYELHGELALLKINLDRVKVRSTQAGYEESQKEAIQRVLGTSAPDFEEVLDRVLKSINDLVSERSLALTDDDTVSARHLLTAR